MRFWRYARGQTHGHAYRNTPFPQRDGMTKLTTFADTEKAREGKLLVTPAGLVRRFVLEERNDLGGRYSEK